MKRLFRNRRALSPVLSAVFMILIVVTGMSILFAFFVNYAGNFQRGSGSAVLESLAVEDVWFGHPLPNKSEVWVYNFGKVDLTISSVYINGQLVSIEPSSLDIPVGGHGNLTLTASYSFQREPTSYTFKIVTQRGTVLEGRYIWH
jgi:hypothetical protein